VEIANRGEAPPALTFLPPGPSGPILHEQTSQVPDMNPDTRPDSPATPARRRSWAEPWKVKVVEPIRMLKPEQRNRRWR